MTDKTELKRLAEEVISAAELYAADSCNDYLATNWAAADDAFRGAASPTAILALLTEKERLSADEQEAADLCDRLSDLLRSTAIEVRGPEEPLKRHSFHDLPSRVKTVISERDQLQAEVERLKTENQSEVGACLLSVAENKKLQAENEALRGLYQMHKATETREMRYLKTENEALRKDAERYRWLRGQNWSQSEMAVVCQPKKAVKLGFDCPSEGRLDSAIDSAMSEGEQS